jgi:hypothetical protein
MVAKVNTSAEDEDASEGGGSESGGSESNGFEGSGSEGASKEPSVIEKIQNTVTNGVPFAGGNITPAKVGNGYGAKWTMKFSTGGKVSQASKRADGIAQRGKTKGRYL